MNCASSRRRNLKSRESAAIWHAARSPRSPPPFRPTPFQMPAPADRSPSVSERVSRRARACPRTRSRCRRPPVHRAAPGRGDPSSPRRISAGYLGYSEPASRARRDRPTSFAPYRSPHSTACGDRGGISCRWHAPPSATRSEYYAATRPLQCGDPRGSPPQSPPAGPWLDRNHAGTASSGGRRAPSPPAQYCRRRCAIAYPFVLRGSSFPSICADRSLARAGAKCRRRAERAVARFR